MLNVCVCPHTCLFLAGAEISQEGQEEDLLKVAMHPVTGHACTATSFSAHTCLLLLQVLIEGQEEDLWKAAMHPDPRKANIFATTCESGKVG